MNKSDFIVQLGYAGYPVAFCREKTLKELKSYYTNKIPYKELIKK